MKCKLEGNGQYTTWMVNCDANV